MKILLSDYEGKSPVEINKSMAAASQNALDKLRSFLDVEEPKLAYFLQNFWGDQQNAITYKEIREAIMLGYLSEKLLEDWHRDYSVFVNKYVAPTWKKAMEAANEPIKRNGLIWRFDADNEAVKRWTDTQTAIFVTRSTDDQIKAIRELVRRATQLHDLNVDTLSHVIRATVGLNHRQAVANMNYYTSMVENGVSERAAREKAIRYSSRQHRNRAYMISRTELAFSYNQGAFEGTRQAIEQGFMGHTVKKWCTAADERLCSWCKSLEGVEIEMDEEFYFKPKSGTKNIRINPRLNHKTIGKVSPAHPNCRCCIMYVEKEPPQPIIT